jgi:hypothetical protein
MAIEIENQIRAAAGVAALNDGTESGVKEA